MRDLACDEEERTGLTSLSAEWTNIPTSTRESSRWRALRWTSITLVAILATWGALDTGRRTLRMLTRDDRPCICGLTTADGLARGCHFDEIELAWMRPDCIDVELTDEFSRASNSSLDGTWQYQTELADERRLVNATELSMLVEPGRTVWFSYEQHVVHCIFEWRKQFRRQFNSVVGHAVPSQEEHIKHCGKMMLLDAGMDEMRTKLVYPSKQVTY